MFSILSVSLGSIIIVDNIDATTITTTHEGADTISLLGSTSGSFASISIVGDGVFVFDGVAGIGFTQGADISNNIFSSPTVFYVGASPGFGLGASSDINFGRLDLDNDGAFETVVEFNFGPDSSQSDDLITRYAYHDGGDNLQISEAVLAFDSVPEPTSVTLLSVGGLCLLGRRKRG